MGSGEVLTKAHPVTAILQFYTTSGGLGGGCWNGEGVSRRSWSPVSKPLEDQVCVMGEGPGATSRITFSWAAPVLHPGLGTQ